MRTAPAEALLDSPRLKPRGNAATGAPFAGGVLDSRLRGNDGSIHARLADLQGQTFLPVLAPVIVPKLTPQTAPQTMPENVDKIRCSPCKYCLVCYQKQSWLHSASSAPYLGWNKKDTHVYLQ